MHLRLQAFLLGTLSVASLLGEDLSQGLHRFPDFKLEYLPPKTEYTGKLFRLSQQFPTKLPSLDPAVQRILEIPYDAPDENGSSPWIRYLMAVRDYAFEGNIEVDWQGQDNEIRKWYHVPWQHFGEKGREGIHGLTREATAVPKQLAPTQKDRFQTHAVAIYNDIGGYTIGQVWKDQFEPDPTKSKFEVGTIVAKILFTEADSSQVPYLKNPITWKAYIRDPLKPEVRKVQDLRLLQMDIMVRDDRGRAEGRCGWVFGTYCYNGELNRPNKWENLVPVGIQWGNDPDFDDPEKNFENAEPTETKINPELKETRINKSSELPPQHLGWGGRLNGPADYFRSSCMSCHSTAQYPSLEKQHPDFVGTGETPKGKPGDPQWNAWFRNLQCGTPFSPMTPMLKYDKSLAHSTDYSLQLAIGIDQFYNWKQNVMGGYFNPVLPKADRPHSQPERSTPTSEAP